MWMIAEQFQRAFGISYKLSRLFLETGEKQDQMKSLLQEAWPIHPIWKLLDQLQ